MKTIFDSSTRDELIRRIHALTENSMPQWGKMNIHQMLNHCARWEEMILRNKRYKRPLLGVLLGKMFLKRELKDGKPMRKNSPTIPELKILETSGNIETEKARWTSLLNEYAIYSFPDYSFRHPFFGKMTKEQIGYHAYKHSDHHLRQFNG